MNSQTPQAQQAPDKMLQRIRAILAKAEDPAATVAEAEAYTVKAAELMARYGVDRALLAEADPTSDVPGDRIIVISGSYAKDKQHLCSTVAMALGCKSVLRTRYVDEEKQRSLHLFGYGADLDRAELLYTSLLMQAANGMARTPVPYGEHVAAFRRSWLAGFSSAIGGRLRAAEQRAQHQADQGDDQSSRGRSFALVLADRSSVVQAKVSEAYPKLGKARTRRLSGRGFQTGQAAGRRADLGGTALADRSRGRIGGAR